MKRMNLTRIIRGGIAVLFLFTLAIIVRYFIVRSREKLQILVDTEKIVQQKIEKKEGIEHIESKGKELTHNIKAVRQYWGEDNKYHLEGNVEIIFFKKREGKDVSLYGDQVIYDKDMTHFLSSGHAKAEYKDLVVESVLLHYDKEKDIFWTESGMVFSSGKLEGSAQKTIYSMKEERIELHQNIELHVKLKPETSPPVIIKGKDLEYDREKKRGRIEGGVNLFQGESQASAELLEFEMNPGEGLIKTLILKSMNGNKGKVKASLIEEEEKNITSKTQPSFMARSIKREVEAEEIALQGFSDISAIQAIEARGNCSFKFIASSGAFTHILADTIKFAFDKEGGLKEFQALKNSRMIDQAENSEEQRLIVGETLSITGNTDTLQVRGKGPFGATITSSDSEIFAEEFTVFLDKNNLESKRGVKAVLKPKKEEENPIGIFSKEYPVFIRSREMRYFDEQKRFLFNGEIKAWQEKKILSADEIDLYKETGKIICTGKVKSILPQSKKEEEKEEERVDISSGRMVYEPKEKVVLYQEGSSLKTKDFDLKAQSVFVYLKEEGEGIERIIARSKVSIYQNSVEGKGEGEEAIYEPEKKSIVLSGNPIFFDKDMGTTRGEKLTFYPADGRILVENKGKERSVTVIKRER